jgi:hypothetical protein
MRVSPSMLVSIPLTNNGILTSPTAGEECAKAYGTLNHLNAHIQMQRHGEKRNPNGAFDIDR